MATRTGPRPGAASAAVAAAGPQPEAHPALTDAERAELLTELRRADVLAHKPGQVGLTLQQVAERIHVKRAEALRRLIAGQEAGIVAYDGAYYTAAEPVAEAPAAPAPELAPGEKFELLPIGLIEVVGNVRKRFDPDELAELAGSIREDGVLVPLLVRPAPSGGRYPLVAGERRLRACQLAGLQVVPCIVRPMTETQAARVQLLENLQRVDLDPIEEALAYQELIEKHGVRASELAKELGKSESAISNRRRLLRLPEAARDDISHGKLSPSVAMAVLSLDVPEPLAARVAAGLVEVGATQATAARAADAILADNCPRVDVRQWDGKGTCSPEDHKECPCRRLCEPRWHAGKIAVCVDPSRYASIEALAQDRNRQEAEAAATKAQAKAKAAANKPVVNLSKMDYGAYVDLQRSGDKDPPAEHRACACLRVAKGRYDDSLCWVCVDPKKHRGMVSKASRVRNKEERTALVAENERIQGWAAAVAAPAAIEGRVDVAQLASRDLAWLATHLLYSIDPEYIAGGTTQRVKRESYLHERLGYEGHADMSTQGQVADYLATLPAEIVWRTCLEWPALCVGEKDGRSYGHHAPFAWYRGQYGEQRAAGGNASQAGRPLVDVLGQRAGGADA